MAKSATAAKVIPIESKTMQKVKKAAGTKTKLLAKDKQAVPKWQHVHFTVREILEMIANKSLKIDPIGNRPSTVDAEGNAKNCGIINSILEGIGVSQIILRDISDQKDLMSLYGIVVDYVVLDGGHRTRAFKWFVHEDRFGITINGKTFRWKNLSDAQREFMMNFPIPVSIVKCDAEQAMEIFLAYNKTTVVKPYSIIMSNEQSEICKFVRQQTRTWDEYGTFCHKVFRLEDEEPKYHHGRVPNKHNLWDTYVFIAIHKILGKGNVAAGESQTKQLITTVDSLTKDEKAEVKKFLDTLLEIYNYNQKPITLEYFGCFQAVYFAEYEDANGNLKIGDMQLFAHKFHAAWAKLTSKKNNRTHLNHKGEPVPMYKFIEDAAIEFTHVKQQREVAALFRKEMYK